MLSAGIYATSASANALVAFFLVPFLTYYLSPADYGTVETFLAASLGITSIVIIGGNTILSKEYFALPETELSQLTGELLGSILIVAGVLLLGILSAMLLTGTELAGMSASLLALAVVVAVGNATSNLLLTGYQLSSRPGLYAAFVNGRTVIELALSLFLVGAIGLAWTGRVGAIVATSVLSTAVVTAAFWLRGIGYRLPASYRGYILGAAPALVMANLTGWTNDMADRFIVANMMDLHATGLYSVGYRFGMVISVLETSFARAWQPFFFENIQKRTPEADRRIVKTAYAYIGGLVVVTIGYSLVSPYLLRLMVANAYEDAAGMIPIVSAGYCCAGIWKLFTGYLISAGKNILYATTLAVTAAINVVLSILLVRRLGYVGAAWGTLITFAIGAAWTATLAHRTRPMPWLLRPQA